MTTSDTQAPGEDKPIQKARAEEPAKAPPKTSVSAFKTFVDNLKNFNIFGRRGIEKDCYAGITRSKGFGIGDSEHSFEWVKSLFIFALAALALYASVLAIRFILSYPFGSTGKKPVAVAHPKTISVMVQGEKRTLEFPLNATEDLIVRELKKSCFRPVLTYQDRRARVSLSAVYYLLEEYRTLLYFELSVEPLQENKPLHANPRALKELTDNLNNGLSCQEPNVYNNYPNTATLPSYRGFGDKRKAVLVSHNKLSDSAVMLWLKLNKGFLGTRSDIVFKIPVSLIGKNVEYVASHSRPENLSDDKMEIKFVPSGEGKFTATLVKL